MEWNGMETGEHTPTLGLLGLADLGPDIIVSGAM